VHNEEAQLSEPRPFRVCQSCGQIIPSRSIQCQYCGAVLEEGLAIAEQEGESRILNDLFTRGAPITPIIIGVNVAIYLLITLTAGGNFWSVLATGADRFTLLAFGAQNSELLQNGEWFRLITPAFVHIGLLHLGLNSYVLWTIGPLVEKLYGSARFLMIYLLTAAGGCFGSFLNHLLKNDLDGASAGASGAIFGLFGVVAAFSYRYRGELPERFLKALKSGVLPAIAVNLVIGFSIKYVDNAAHIGGLLTGALLAFVVPYIPANVSQRISRTGLAILAICIVVILTSFVFAYRQSPPLLNRRQSKIETLLNNFEAADRAMVNIFRSADGNWKPTPQDLSQLTTAAQALETSVAPDAKTEEIRQGFLRLLNQQKEIISQFPPDTLRQKLGTSGEELLKQRKAFETWLKQDGPAYGFTLREPSEKEK
jgi:membrane associated rhomboid family serine protease